MNFDAIPVELKSLRQWVLWRAIVNDGAVTKPPYQPNNPAYMADVNSPSDWGSFEDAVRVYTNNPSLFSGIGFVFTDDDPYFGLDIDDEAKVKPQFLETRKRFISQIMSQVDTYTEVSPSGNGLHMIGRGKLPVDGKRSVDMQVELYCSLRYFTITGDVLNNRTEIKDQQEFLLSVFGAIVPDTGAQVVHDTETYRRLDLTDSEVIRLATNFNPTFAPRFNAQTGCGPGEWSDTFMAIVGMIDRFTGSVEQVQRLIFNSPMVLLSPPSNAGETRLNKAQRNLQYVLSTVRRGNDGLMHFSEHGRQIVENIERAKADRAHAAAAELARAEEAVGNMSKGSQTILEAFPELVNEHKILTRPPGVVGQFVRATEMGSFKPFTKFAIPATLSALAGIVARGFKLPGGSGLNLNFILAAPSNAGKTMTMNAWQRFMADASQAVGDTPSGQSKDRILNSSTSSIQGIMPDFMDKPSLVWFVEECYSQLHAMNEGKSPSDAHLRDAYNQLYDAGMHGKLFSGPRSVANSKKEIEPINNLCVSTFWTTTVSKFDLFNEDALDGFMSRVVVIRHHAPGGEPMQYLEDMPPHLRDILIQRLAAAKHLDETYRLGPFEAGKLLTVISNEQISEIHWSFVKTVDGIANAAIRGELPPTYGAISRVPLTALRIAGVMAVIENPYTPSITLEQYKWAVGYLLLNLVELLTSVDVGDLGNSATDEVLTVVRTIKRMLKLKGADEPGIPRQELRDALKHVKPFSISRDLGPGRSKRVSDTLLYMLAENMIEEVAGPMNGRPGRPPTYISPVMTDPIWRK